ncbi:MAG: regulatory protein RecX [Gemmatimonadaceae bacterium]
MSANPYEYSLNLLSARAYTARNLRRKLVQKAFDPADIETTMGRLIASRLIDDARFASEYARQKLTIGGTSSRRVEQELQKRGISREIARDAVGSVIDEESIDTSASADRAAKKKFKSLAGLDVETQRRRLFGFLSRRGFDIDDVKRAVAVVISSEGDTAD